MFELRVDDQILRQPEFGSYENQDMSAVSVRLNMPGLKRWECMLSPCVLSVDIKEGFYGPEMHEDAGSHTILFSNQTQTAMDFYQQNHLVIQEYNRSEPI